MDILVIGSGGREHALAWKIAQSARARRVFVAPGNGGIDRDSRLISLGMGDMHDLIGFVRRESIALTVVGPEVLLAQGIVDAFRAAGLRIFGPTRAAAQLEWSKSFAKDFLKRHHIPTAKYQIFSNLQRAQDYIATHGTPIVVKADGLAAGKGVTVATTREEAHKAAEQMFRSQSDQKIRIVIEEFLEGEEISFIVMVDGKNVLPMASSRDYKRLLDNDKGPNTGGMGAYSPAPFVTPDVHDRIMQEIIEPTLEGMRKEGITYTGFLYAGLMLDAVGHPKVIEFNCRLGDPETQVILLRLQSDFVTLLEAGIDGKLDQIEVEWDARPALGVILAAAHYPAIPQTGDIIKGLPDQRENIHIFHAGTACGPEGQLLTSGGRVVCVAALGDSLAIARQRAYETLSPIQFNGMQYRRDIGQTVI